MAFGYLEAIEKHPRFVGLKIAVGNEGGCARAQLLVFSGALTREESALKFDIGAVNEGVLHTLNLRHIQECILVGMVADFHGLSRQITGVHGAVW